MEINIFIDGDVEGCPEADWLENIVTKVTVVQGIDAKAELSLVITGFERIQQLNRDYLGEDRPTDVLAFPMLSGQSDKDAVPFIAPPDEKIHLGEVIICCPQAVIQAEEHGHSVKREMAILIIHGVLHLLDYDHDKPERESEMRDRESAILRNIEEELI